MISKLKIFSLVFASALLFTSCDEDDFTPNDDEDEVPEEETCLSLFPSGLQSGMIAYYPFSQGSLEDFSGNGNDLENNTSAVSGTDREGNQGCAFSFDAANQDFLEYATPTFLDDIQDAPFSISLWYQESIDSPTTYNLLIGRDTGMHCPDTFGQWSLGLYDLDAPVFGINKNSIWNFIDPSLELEWKHLVVTSDGTSGGINIYINGESTSDTPSGDCSTSVSTENEGDLFLGMNFTGLLDDVIIYDRELDLSEINELYELPACCE